MNNVEEFNDNLFFVFEKLLMDKELAEKFAECKTEDELYNFCLKIKGGYTKEEWEKFAEIIYKLTINKENDKILLDNDLEEIGGGSMTNNIGKKALSGTLAALTAATVLQVGSVGASAASSSSKPKTSVSQRSSSPRWKKIIRGVLIGAGVAAVAAALGYGVHRFIEHKKEKNNTPKIFNEQPNSPNSSIKNNKQPGNLTNKPNLLPLEYLKDGRRGCLPNLKNGCFGGSFSEFLYQDEEFRKKILQYNGPKKDALELKYIFEVIEGSQPLDEDRLEKSYKVCFGYTGAQEDPTDLLNGFKRRFSEFGVPEICTLTELDGGTETMQYLLNHINRERVDFKRAGITNEELEKFRNYVDSFWQDAEKERVSHLKRDRKPDPYEEETPEEKEARKQAGIEQIMVDKLICRSKWKELKKEDEEYFKLFGILDLVTRLANDGKRDIEYCVPLEIGPGEKRFIVRFARDDGRGMYSDRRVALDRRTVNDKNVRRFSDPFDVKIGDKDYVLDSVVYHGGTDNGGHYVCLKRDSSGHWLSYDTMKKYSTIVDDQEVERVAREGGILFGYVEKVVR